MSQYRYGLSAHDMRLEFEKSANYFFGNFKFTTRFKQQAITAGKRCYEYMKSYADFSLKGRPRQEFRDGGFKFIKLQIGCVFRQIEQINGQTFLSALSKFPFGQKFFVHENTAKVL